MLTAYKFLPRKFADLALSSGVLRIARISEFRQMEGSLGDNLDGGTCLKLDYFDAKDRTNPNYDQVYRDISPMIVEEMCYGTVITGLQYQEFTTDFWALCLARDANSSAQYSYDGALKVLDIEALAETIQQAHANDLGNYQVQNVEYKARTVQAGGGRLTPSPFIKDERFATEREIRVIWQPKRKNGAEIITSSPDIARLVHRL